jgi:hypothetical protein
MKIYRRDGKIFLVSEADSRGSNSDSSPDVPNSRLLLLGTGDLTGYRRRRLLVFLRDEADTGGTKEHSLEGGLSFPAAL